MGREREGVDLSKVVLTHRTLKAQGVQPMPLGSGEYPTLKPITEEGRGAVQEKQRAWLAEIIARVNELFEGELTDQDKLVYVNDVLKGKLLESDTLREQASSNTKEQFASSPDLKAELMNAIIGALDAHTTMSSQALASEAIREGLRDVLLNHAGLYEALRQPSAAPIPEDRGLATGPLGRRICYPRLELMSSGRLQPHHRSGIIRWMRAQWTSAYRADGTA